MLAGVLSSGLTVGTISLAKVIGVLQQFASYLIRLGEAVGAACGKYVPDGNQELASDGHDRLVIPPAWLETSQFGFPVQVAAAGGGTHTGGNRPLACKRARIKAAFLSVIT